MKLPGKRMLRESPWLAGVVAGWILLWLQGRAFVLGQSVLGFGWWDYLMLAWHSRFPIPGQGGSWRNPLYLVLVERLGRDMGYADAATLIASASTWALVLAAGWMGRLLGSPWTGALAALSVPLVRTTAESSRWLTLYPLLAATTGAALALGALLAARPGALPALAAGAMTSLSWAVDWRGLLALPPVVLLAAVAVTRSRRWILVPALLGGLAVGPAIHLALGGASNLSVQAQVEEQRDVVRRWMGTTHDPNLQRDCLALPETSRTGLAYLTSPCPSTLVRYNLTHEFPRELPFGLWPTLVLLPLVLLPGRRGWTGVVTGFSAVFLPFGAILFSTVWVLLPDRYVLHVATATALVVPLALHRAVHTLVPPRFAPWWDALVVTAAGAWLLQQGPPGSRRATMMEMNQDIQAQGRLRVELESRIGPEDKLLDCSSFHAEIMLLPRIHHGPPPVLAAVSQERCAAWLKGPEVGSGATWVVTDDVPPDLGGWDQVWSTRGANKEVVLWKWARE